MDLPKPDPQLAFRLPWVESSECMAINISGMRLSASSHGMRKPGLMARLCGPPGGRVQRWQCGGWQGVKCTPQVSLSGPWAD